MNRTSLLTEFADNTSGLITASRCRDEINNVTMPEDLVAGDGITIDKSLVPQITINATTPTEIEQAGGSVSVDSGGAILLAPNDGVNLTGFAISGGLFTITDTSSDNTIMFCASGSNPCVDINGNSILTGYNSGQDTLNISAADYTTNAINIPVGNITAGGHFYLGVTGDDGSSATAQIMGRIDCGDISAVSHTDDTATVLEMCFPSGSPSCDIYVNGPSGSMQDSSFWYAQEGGKLARFGFANTNVSSPPATNVLFWNNSTGAISTGMCLDTNNHLLIGNQSDNGSNAALQVAGTANVHRVTTTPITLTAGSSVAMDCSTSNVFTLTPNSTTSLTATNIPAGYYCDLIVTTSGTTSYTLTFSTGIKTATSTLATGTVSAKVFVVHYISNGSALIELSRTTAL